MAIYTISPNTLREIDEKSLFYYRSLLFKFISGAHKVAVDRDGHAIDIYSSIEQNRDIIQSWLNLMSYSPSRFESIPVNIRYLDDEERKFLSLCKATKGQHKMIVSSRQSVRCQVDCNNFTEFEGEMIEILNREEAISEIEGTQASISISGNIFANGNVSNSNNNNM